MSIDIDKIAEQMAEAISEMDTDTLDMREVKDSGLYIDMTHDAREYKNKILALNGMTPEQNR
jgi:hypothetical protein